jgi:hypothetical protein
MNNKIIIIVVVVVIIGLVLSGGFFGDSDRKEISNIIDEMEESLEYKKRLPPLVVISRLKKIKSHLAPQFSAKSLSNDNEKVLSGINKVKSAALFASKYFSDINILKIPFSIEVNGKQASTSFNMTISGKDKQNNRFKELFDLNLKFIKIDGTWYCLSISAKSLTPDE